MNQFSTGVSGRLVEKYNHGKSGAEPDALRGPRQRTHKRSGSETGRSLDNITNTATPPPPVNESTGEIIEFDPTQKWQLRQVARLALPGHRIQVCMNHIRPDKREVEIRGGEGRRPYYANLMVCGSVWACPICAAKIQSVRAAEVRQGIDTWTESGGAVLLLTQTVPHTRQDTLQDTLGGILDAQRRYTAGSPMQKLKGRYKVAGDVRALETTWGNAHGWHPHLHTLLFLDQPAQLDELEAAMFKRWQSATGRAGFDPVSPRAFKLQDGSAVRNYVTKMGAEYQWNAEHELVRSHSKRGRRGNFSPFDLLTEHLSNPGRGRNIALFAEFAWTFHGRRQLVYSRGFRQKLVGNNEATDEQIATSIGENDAILSRIPGETWRIIRRRNLQGTILRVVELHGETGLKHLLNNIHRIPTSGY